MERIEQITHELEILKRSERHLRTELDNNREMTSNLMIEKWKLENGLEIGDDVSFKDGGETKTGKLTDIMFRYSRAEPIVTLYKKDGTLGTRTKGYFYGGITKIIAP